MIVYKIRRLKDGTWWTGMSAKQVKLYFKAEWSETSGRIYTQRARATSALHGAASRGHGVELVEFALVEQPMEGAP